MQTTPYPPFYKQWLTGLLPATHAETLATCEKCVMFQPEGLTRDPGPFRPGLKCCTYFPYLPNFTLGALPSSQKAKATQEGLFLPVGLYPNSQRQIRIQQFGKSGFGQESSLLCPFFDSPKDSCSIWEFRPGVCTSYFCKSNQGAEGLRSWAEIEKFLNHFEFQMAKKLCLQLGLTENEIVYGQSAIALETEEDERDFFIQAAWGKWFHRQSEFYAECLKIAETFSENDVSTLLGNYPRPK